jgi:DNA phosphorothioation-dependent restriction protein DptG
MKVALYSLVGIKIFEKRRDYSVLVLDEELLLFLIAMIAKEERIRMEDLFKRFREYGIDFSFQTKNAISEFLLKLNLLERKSDSGEAQYVRVVF